MDVSNLVPELANLSGAVLLQLFIILVVLDVISGYIAAKITNTFSSREATNGIMRQFLRLLVFIAAAYACTIVTPTIQLALVSMQAALIIAYCKSLSENWTKAMNYNQENLED